MPESFESEMLDTPETCDNSVGEESVGEELAGPGSRPNLRTFMRLLRCLAWLVSQNSRGETPWKDEEFARSGPTTQSILFSKNDFAFLVG